jgi:D-sedoheptulose 7-phosphate isomerase
MASVGSELRTIVGERLVARNSVSRAFFEREADHLALACQEMAGRFARGGRLIAFGLGALATDAQHVAVEFVHPVIVGKRALPALDVSASFTSAIPALVSEHDMVMGFSPPAGDAAVEDALALASARGAQTFALPGCCGSYAIEPPSADAFVCQELIEILYHTLWETVHVFFEHGTRSQQDVGASGFLYPFLNDDEKDMGTIVGEVATSIRAKAADDERLRQQTAHDQGEAIGEAALAVLDRLNGGGSLLIFGNGGSATDANDWALDCTAASSNGRTVPALSLAAEPATITGLANDVGTEIIFLRQLIAHGRRGDVAVAISTSGGSANVIAALAEARKRGMLTVALLGYDGGEIARQGLADWPIVVRCDYIPRIQEVQASIYHVMTEVWRQWPM